MTQTDGNSNPDADRPFKSVEQGIHIDRNEGQFNAVSSGDRSNVIQGDGSQITQIQQQTIHHHYVTHPSAEVKRERLPHFWSDRRWVLFFLGCAIVGILGTVETVFHPLKAYQQRMAFQNCAKVAREENKPLVIITKLKKIDRNSKNSRPAGLLEQQIKEDPGGLNALDDVRSCFLNTEIDNLEEANNFGKEKQADIVIWGIIHELSLEIHVTSITSIKSPAYLRKISISVTSKKEFDVRAKNIPPLLTVTIAHEIGFSNRKNNLKASIRMLKRALNLTRDYVELKFKESKDILSQAYFRLGTWVEPQNNQDCSRQKQHCIDALLFYQQATSINRFLYKAKYNSGLLYERLGDFNQAREIYLSILNSTTDPYFALYSCERLIELSSKNELEKLNCQEYIN